MCRCAASLRRGAPANAMAFTAGVLSARAPYLIARLALAGPNGSGTGVAAVQRRLNVGSMSQMVVANKCSYANMLATFLVNYSYINCPITYE
jgi:hypothetical protein